MAEITYEKVKLKEDNPALEQITKGDRSDRKKLRKHYRNMLDAVDKTFDGYLKDFRKRIKNCPKEFRRREDLKEYVRRRKIAWEDNDHESRREGDRLQRKIDSLHEDRLEQLACSLKEEYPACGKTIYGSISGRKDLWAVKAGDLAGVCRDDMMDRLGIDDPDEKRLISDYIDRKVRAGKKIEADRWFESYWNPFTGKGDDDFCIINELCGVFGGLGGVVIGLSSAYHNPLALLAIPGVPAMVYLGLGMPIKTLMLPYKYFRSDRRKARKDLKSARKYTLRKLMELE